jgi:Na+/H+ antiporter NhaD/arsenite permease-like protein
MAWLISEFAAANTASMVLFVGNPTNVVICEGFNINNAAFTAYTILPFLACSITCFLALAAQFRRSEYVPKRLEVAGDLDVRSVLLDPKGAIVGSLLLICCLTIVVVVSFLHVDVWMITLPFAGAKFLFDIAWDHYRYVHKRSTHSTSRKSDEDISGIILRQLRQHRTIPVTESARLEAETIPQSTIRSETTAVNSPSSIQAVNSHSIPNAQEKGQPVFTASPQQTQENLAASLSFPAKVKARLQKLKRIFSKRFPTLYTAVPRLPFALVPFAFSQFILIEALAYQGWIHVFGRWLVDASGRRVYPTIWLVGVLGVILCNCSGTNIGATILLTKVIREAVHSTAADATNVNLEAFSRSAAIALAVSSNIGAVSFTFSASLAGLLWIQILNQKGIKIKQLAFARWNLLPLIVMTGVGLAVVCAEMAVLY